MLLHPSSQHFKLPLKLQQYRRAISHAVRIELFRVNNVQQQRGSLLGNLINLSLGSYVDSSLLKKLELVQQNFLGFTHCINVGSKKLQVL